MTTSQIKRLKEEFSNINRVDPNSPTVKNLVAYINRLPKDTLKQLIDAKIKFVSLLAVNALNRIR